MGISRRYFSKRAKDQGMGRLGGDKPGSGPGGSCVCPSCGYKKDHTTGVPCNEISCPECGTSMTKDSLKSNMDG